MVLMLTVGEICSLNNTAVALMLNQKFDEASQFFDHELDRLGDMEDFVEEETRCQVLETTELFQQQPECQYPPSLSARSFRFVKHVVSNVAATQDTQWTLYNQVFSVDPLADSLVHQVPNEEQFNFLACLMHYNFGLCCHVSGIRQRDDGFLTAALETYRTAGELANEIPRDASSVLILLQLALANNQAHIYHYHFVDFEATTDLVIRIRDDLLPETLRFPLLSISDESSCFLSNLDFAGSHSGDMPAPGA
mmetsp:Transcript_1594/g.2268  ORF Transcript_1594/g.2268 Transcript_1594/m.2268 type:complete len:251 (-) Transcript_1594:72-824(-)